MHANTFPHLTPQTCMLPALNELLAGEEWQQWEADLERLWWVGGWLVWLGGHAGGWRAACMAAHQLAHTNSGCAGAVVRALEQAAGLMSAPQHVSEVTFFDVARTPH